MTVELETRCNGRRRMGTTCRHNLASYTFHSGRVYSRMRLLRGSSCSVRSHRGGECYRPCSFRESPVVFCMKYDADSYKRFSDVPLPGPENDPFVLALLLPTQTQTPFGV